MFTVKIDGLDNLIKDFQHLGSEMPTVVRNITNDLAFMIRSKEIETASRVFDRPKPQTVKNFFVTKATKSNLVATIWFDQIFNRGYEEYMVAEVEGGSRRMKPSERRLGHFYVPGIGAKMDRFGNMQGGQTTQILSQLGRFGDVAGYNMNQTAASKKRRSGGSKSTEYFIISKQTGSLKPGVYQRTEKRNGYTSVGSPKTARGKTGAFQKSVRSFIQGRGVVPVMVFTKQAPTYRPRFPFYAVANEVINKYWRQLFDKEIGFAIRRQSR
jgi:hypothetical protein